MSFDMIWSLVQQKADLDENGKVTPLEFATYLLKNPVFIFLAFLVVSITPILSFLKEGFATQSWDFNTLLTSIIGAIFALIMYLVGKMLDKNFQEVAKKVEDAANSRLKKINEILNQAINFGKALEKDNDSLRLTNQLLVQKMDIILLNPNAASELFKGKDIAVILGIKSLIPDAKGNIFTPPNLQTITEEKKSP